MKSGLFGGQKDHFALLKEDAHLPLLRKSPHNKGSSISISCFKNRKMEINRWVGEV